MPRQFLSGDNWSGRMRLPPSGSEVVEQETLRFRIPLCCIQVVRKDGFHAPTRDFALLTYSFAKVKSLFAGASFCLLKGRLAEICTLGLDTPIRVLDNWIEIRGYSFPQGQLFIARSGSLCDSLVAWRGAVAPACAVFCAGWLLRRTRWHACSTRRAWSTRTWTR